MAYGDETVVRELALESTETRDLGDLEKASDVGTERFVDLNIVDAGHAVESDDEHGHNEEIEEDSGTTTDDYDADTSEAEHTPGTIFNRSRYEEVTGGLSEMSVMDTMICVGFGYALVYAS